MRESKKPRFLRLRRRRKPVALVLSGGGPLGALQVGMIRALFSHGVAPDVVVGVSVGAFNAVFVASDPTPSGMEELGEIWLRMRKSDLFPGGRLSTAIHALRKGSHVFDSSGLRRLIDAELEVESFEELRVPAHVLATNLETGEEAWFSSGRILEPLIASAALPGLFPPVVIEGVRYVDGGIANNVPISKAVELGAGKIYVLNTTGATQRRDLSRPHDFMMHGMVLARSQRYRRDLVRYAREAEIIDFPPPDVGYVAFTDMSHTEELIEAGFTQGLRFLQEGSPPQEPDDEEAAFWGSA